MPRIRTAKALSRRIDLQYFKRPHGLRKAQIVLSIILSAAALLWLLIHRAVGSQNVYTSGPLSSAHAVFGAQCALCHVKQASFRAHVSDSACLSCHDAPVHNIRQAFTPACTSCHVEHEGNMRLAATADSGCVQCHSELKTTDGKLNFDAHIAGFDKKHPQFAPMRAGYVDPGTIKLNHFVHLQPTVRGPRGQVQMQCSDCHRFAMREPWPYSVATVQPATQMTVSVGETLEQQRKRRDVGSVASAYALPIKYVNQCAACHLLQFDPLIAEPAPHDKPDVVRAFILAKLEAYVASHPEVLRQPVDANLPLDEEPRRNILRQTEVLASPTARLASSPQQWVQQRADVAERLLWKKNCNLCHAQTEEQGGVLPTKVKAVIPMRWLVNAEFDHQAHRMMTCTACHSRVQQSRATSDINLPDIAVCRNCHQQAGRSVQAADGRCFECHSYHDWRKEKPIKGKFDIAHLRSSHAGPADTQPSAGKQAE